MLGGGRTNHPARPALIVRPACEDAIVATGLLERAEQRFAVVELHGSVGEGIPVSGEAGGATLREPVGA
jgi:hypothetical protein